MAKTEVTKTESTPKEADKLDQILSEVMALRAEIKMLKMNLLQINQLKNAGGMRV